MKLDYGTSYVALGLLTVVWVYHDNPESPTFLGRIISGIVTLVVWPLYWMLAIFYYFRGDR